MLMGCRQAEDKPRHKSGANTRIHSERTFDQPILSEFERQLRSEAVIHVSTQVSVSAT
jgi:hypothetical protein